MLHNPFPLQTGTSRSLQLMYTLCFGCFAGNLFHMFNYLLHEPLCCPSSLISSLHGRVWSEPRNLFHPLSHKAQPYKAPSTLDFNGLFHDRALRLETSLVWHVFTMTLVLVTLLTSS